MGEKKVLFVRNENNRSKLYTQTRLSFFPRKKERKKETPDIGHHSRSFEASFHLEQRSERIFFLPPIFPLPLSSLRGRKKERKRERRAVIKEGSRYQGTVEFQPSG